MPVSDVRTTADLSDLPKAFLGPFAGLYTKCIGEILVCDM